MVELDRHEIATAKVAVEPEQEYQVFFKVISTSARHDAAMLTFSVDVPLTPEEAVKYFPRFTQPVGKPFAFIPNESGGVASVRFRAPPSVRLVTIGARRWASDGDVKIGRCLAIQTGDASAAGQQDPGREPPGSALPGIGADRDDLVRAARTTFYELPGAGYCELVIDASLVTHLTALASFTTTIGFRDAEGRPTDRGAQVFRCAAYPGVVPADAALVLPLEVPPGASGITVGIGAADGALKTGLRFEPRRLDPPQDFADFITALKDRLDRRAAAIRTISAEVAPARKIEVDEWLCSERVAVLQRAATLFGPQAEIGAAARHMIVSSLVVPGTLLEIRLAPVLVPALREPSAATLTVSFLDADGKPLPDAGHQDSWSRWTRLQYPLSFEAEAFDQQAHYAAPHYIVVPPRARSLAVELRGAAACGNPEILVRTVTAYDNEIPLLIRHTVAYLNERLRFLTRLARGLPALARDAILSAEAAERQDCIKHLTIFRNFLVPSPNAQVWRAANAATSFDIPGLSRVLPELAGEERAPGTQASKLRVGVIGSRDFIYCLSVWHDVTPLTPDVLQAAATILPLDIVVLQYSDRLTGGWPQAFFGYLDAAIPRATLEFVRSLRKRGLPVVLVADPAIGFLRLIENWADELDWVVILGPGAEDESVAAALADRQNVVRFPLLVETRLHRPVIQERLPAFSVLYSSLSDLFDFRDNIAYLQRVAHGGLVIADRHWELVIERIKQNLQAPDLNECIFGSASTEQWALLCRHSAVALFFEDSLLPRYKAAQVMAEAIANGAVAVYVGDASQLGELAESIIAVETPYQLALVLRQLRFDWYRRRVWLRAFRRLHRRSRFERLAIWLQNRVMPDAPAQPALPKATMVTISKRPHLLDYCVGKFRHQTYADVELVLVVNADVDDALIAKTAESDPRIRIYKIPKEFNIGYCLNMAISVANGKIWLKCDDDDFYGPHYVEDMLNTFHFSGADIVGKPQWYTYFEDLDATYIRTVGRERERTVLRSINKEFLTGATLSAETEAIRRENLWFSNTIRMAVDSEWVRAANDRGLAIFFSDPNNFVIHRAADLGGHTWSVSNEALRRQTVRLVAGSPHDLIC